MPIHFPVVANSVKNIITLYIWKISYFIYKYLARRRQIKSVELDKSGDWEVNEIVILKTFIFLTFLGGKKWGAEASQSSNDVVLDYTLQTYSNKIVDN